MSKSWKILFIIGASLATLGALLFVTVFAISGWDITKLSDKKHETNSYTFTDSVSSIAINSDTADITIVPSFESYVKVVCEESEDEKHTVSVKNGTLSISLVESEWYEYISVFSFGETKITVYLPIQEYGKLSITEHTGDVEISKDFKFESIDITASTGSVKCYASASKQINITTSTGDMLLSDLSAGSLDLKTSTGHVSVSSLLCSEGLSLKVNTGDATLQNISCKSFTSSGSTGDLSMKNLIAKDKMSIERDTGDVTLDRCDANEIEINTSTGDVKGSVRSDKTFFVQSDTGRVTAPETVSDQICRVTCSTGDIDLVVSP